MILLVVVEAMTLDVLSVRYVTPAEASSADGTLLLSLALPSIGLCLAATVKSYGLIWQHPATQEHDIEVGRDHTCHEPLKRAAEQRQSILPQIGIHRVLAELPANGRV